MLRTGRFSDWRTFFSSTRRLKSRRPSNARRRELPDPRDFEARRGTSSSSQVPGTLLLPLIVRVHVFIVDLLGSGPDCGIIFEPSKAGRQIAGRKICSFPNFRLL